MTVAPVEQSVEYSPVDVAELDDAELVRRARAGGESAFTQLIHRYDDRMRATARSIVTGADLDDVSQRTWLKIFHKLDTLREPRLFQAWANRIMVNMALGYVRKRRRRSRMDIDDLPRRQAPTDESPGAEELVRWRDLLDKTHEWMDQLDERDRKLFRYFLVDGLTMEEIGEKVGMSPGGVKVRLFRARETLRAKRQALDTTERRADS